VREYEEAGVIGDEWESDIFNGIRPADPLIARLTLQGWGCSADQSQPIGLVDSDIRKRFSDEGMEPKVMVLTHEIMPACSFVREN
jgi:hypothetical protein